MRSFFLNKVILFPYYMVLKTRHFLYDKGIFASYSFDIPIIVIGNVSAGGTGKTPHTEFILKQLAGKEKIAVLSRGYGRSSRGFRFVSCNDTASMSGDEPLQIKKKFPEAIVAVDANRVRGIKTLMALPDGERPTLILMDDAFQHRRVKPSKSIVLIDYSNPPFSDNLLPFGTLRDLPCQIYRADTVIVTKCPPEVSVEEQFEWKTKLRLAAGQKLFFSALEYGDALPVFENGDKRYVYSNFAQMVTAIANPLHLEYQLSASYKVIRKVKYRDHKNFGRRDVSLINRMAKANPKAVIFTTEKDAQRLLQAEGLSDNAKLRLFYYPLEVSLLNGDWQDLAIENSKK